MANKEQLAILKQGVAAWNKWREENPDAKINLRGAKLDGFDLSGANFRQADIRGTSFKKALLVHADFTKIRAGESFLQKFILSIQQNKTLFLIMYSSSIFTLLYGVVTGGYMYAEWFLSISLTAVLTKIFFLINHLKDVPYTNFYMSNLKNSIFDESSFDESSFEINAPTVFSNSILDGSSWKNVYSVRQIFFTNTILADDAVLKLLVYGGEQGLLLYGKNLKGACLVEFDLRDSDLRVTDLMQANFSKADITGAKLWGSARDNWIIDGIRCEYVYWDEAGEQRTPPDRDFRPGEFEELYKQLPTFEYVFANGFTPLDPLIMDRVVQAVNERHKEFSLELVNFDKRGQPHATFTVCHLEHLEKAKQQIAAGYEESKGSPEQQAQLMAAVLGLIENQNKLIDKIPSSRGLAMGDTYNISGQIGAVGQSASATGNTFQQITADLSRLHEEMQRSAKTPEQRAAAEDVAKAAQAAREQNEPALRQHLKTAGKFALDCAKTVGTDVAADILKKVAGL